MAYVEIDVGGVGLEHLREDRSADDVPRGQFGGLAVVGHEAVAVHVEQEAAFAAEGLGDEGADAPAI